MWQCISRLNIPLQMSHALHGMQLETLHLSVIDDKWVKLSNLCSFEVCMLVYFFYLGTSVLVHFCTFAAFAQPPVCHHRYQLSVNSALLVSHARLLTGSCSQLFLNFIILCFSSSNFAFLHPKASCIDYDNDGNLIEIQEWFVCVLPDQGIHGVWSMGLDDFNSFTPCIQDLVQT